MPVNNKQQDRTGVLYVIATPIGNLEDISSRAIATLKMVDLIACEDTRHTRKLLSRYAITTPLTSYFREREEKKSRQLVQKLLQGQNIGLVSDAGTPGISDPGALLVRRARQEGIRVVPVPGPSALTTALSVAGLDDSAFFFGGFPPGKRSARRSMLTSLADLPCPLIFYEAPHRIGATLKDCLEIFGDRQAMVFRELSKLHEECVRGPLSTLLSRFEGKVRGELVLVVAGRVKNRERQPHDLDELIVWYRDQGDYSLRDCVHRIAADLDLPRSQVYRRALEIW